MLICTFKQAETYLALHIPKNSQQRFPGELGLKRTKYFLHLLGDPQEKLKIVHVAGTSGKGSTCYLISSLLASQGFKVGFHQSPHLTDVRERFQINNKIISKKEFIFYLNKIIPIISVPLTYFEILVGLAFYIFNEKKLDYAVMETGLGGWYDATNVVERSDKLSVLTKIGLDHTNILGKTIKEIAFQKAMIINKDSQAISINQDPGVEKVIKEVARLRQAKVIFVTKNNYLYHGRGQDNYKLNLIGDYQKENACLALAAVNFLSKRDGFVINQDKINKVFETAKFPGRFDIRKILPAGRQVPKTVIFDGAHSPQKMLAFINTLIREYPDKKFNFLLAFKKGKDYQDMLKIIVLSTAVGKIIITSFFTENQDMINASEEPAIISQQLKKLGFTDFEISPSLKEAWEIILNKKEPIVVTGSLYLVGEVFKIINNK